MFSSCIQVHFPSCVFQLTKLKILFIFRFRYAKDQILHPNINYSSFKSLFTDGQFGNKQLRQTKFEFVFSIIFTSAACQILHQERQINKQCDRLKHQLIFIMYQVVFLADEVQIMLTLTFGSANCQKMHRNKETNILKTRFPYGKLLREGAFENDLPSFLIVFFIMYQVLFSK